MTDAADDDGHSERTERFRRYRKEAAKRLECSPDDERCEHVAVLRLVRDGIAATVISGVGSPELQLRISENMLRIDDALKQVLPAPKPLTVEVQLLDSLPRPDLPPAPPSGTPPTPPAPPAPLSALEAGRRSIDVALGRRATIDAPNYTPPKPPTPPKDFEPYHPEFGNGQPNAMGQRAPVKGGVGNIGRNQFMGVFTQPASERAGSFPSDPSMKPVVPDEGKK